MYAFTHIHIIVTIYTKWIVFLYTILFSLICLKNLSPSGHPSLLYCL